MTYSPWPDKHFRLELNKATWVTADPFYGDYPLSDLKWIKVRKFWFPFLAVKLGQLHFYIGWKPITLDDPKFYWRSLVGEGLFVQLSARAGYGIIT